MLVRKPKCPLTVVEKTTDGRYKVYLSKHIWIAEAEAGVDLEGPIGDAFGITTEDAKVFSSYRKAVDFADKVSEFMDRLVREAKAH